MRKAACEYVEDFWATTLPRAQGSEDSPVVVGVHRGSLTDYAGVFVVERRGMVVISAPSRLVRELQQKSLWPDNAMDPVWWLAQLPGWIVLGPSVHAFLDGVDLLPQSDDAESPTVAQIADALRHRVTPAEWAESGFGGGDIVKAWLLRNELGHPVAAANLTLFNGIPADVGLITAIDTRARGYGRTVSAAAVRWAIEHHGIAR